MKLRVFVVSCSEPPRIDSFSFPRRKLYDRVSVSCVVSSGDLPINIAWSKDGADIPHQLGVVVQVSQDRHRSVQWPAGVIGPPCVCVCVCVCVCACG